MEEETKEDIIEVMPSINDERIEVSGKSRVGQEQIYNLLLSRELSWQEIIYDLIKTEQLDPWDIDLTLLAAKYLEKIQLLEEANFFVSSKVLLASSVLLRLKSDILLHHYIRSLDEVLFGKKEQKYKPVERLELDDELPELIPKTPLPRLKKVSLPELMQALDRAMITEHRRIKRDIIEKQARRFVGIVLPKLGFNLKDKIKEIYGKIKDFLKKENGEKVTFSYLVGDGGKEEKMTTFIPLLHLDHQCKVELEQHEHFGEIYVSLKEKRKEGNIESEVNNQIREEFVKIEENIEHENEQDLNNKETNN